MGELELDWYNLVARGAIIYLGLFVMFRLMGKKQLGEMSPFDFVLLLIISEAVSNGLTGGDDSVGAALIVAGTLIGIAVLIDFIAYKSRTAEKVLDGVPQVIVRNGKIVKATQKKANMSESELMEALREKEVTSLDQVKIARIETNGAVTVEKKAQ